MLDVQEVERRRRAEKARGLRYKKAIAVNMNLDAIRQWCWDVQDSLEDVTYVQQNEDMFLSAFDGDDEEAFEFRMAFQSLSGDVERFQQDLADEWIPACFDDFFCAVSGHGQEYAGYDAVEEDYFGLSSFEAELAVEEAAKRLERLTKKELIEAAQRCYQVSVAYLGLRSRYEDLRAAVDIIRAQNDGLMQGIKAIEQLYEQWSNATYTGQYEFARQIDNIACQMPDEVWLR